MHSINYNENKDDISEDLLADFKDEDEEDKYIKPKTLNSLAKGQSDVKQNVMVQQSTMLSEFEYLCGNQKEAHGSKIIDVQSQQDFPTLGGLPGKK